MKQSISVASFVIAIAATTTSQQAYSSSIELYSSNVEIHDSIPLNVTLNRVVSNSHLFLFKESSSKTLSHDLYVNFSDTGPYTPSVTDELATDIIAANTTVDSYLLHFDSIGKQLVEHSGFFRFDNPVLGVISSLDSLLTSDEILGNSNTQYGAVKPQRGSRGMEGIDNPYLPVRDIISLSSDRRTVHFEMGVTGWFDQVRFVVASVPEPNSALLALVSLSVLSLMRRRLPLHTKTA